MTSLSTCAGGGFDTDLGVPYISPCALFSIAGIWRRLDVDISCLDMYVLDGL